MTFVVPSLIGTSTSKEEEEEDDDEEDSSDEITSTWSFHGNALFMMFKMQPS